MRAFAAIIRTAIGFHGMPRYSPEANSRTPGSMYAGASGRDAAVPMCGKRRRAVARNEGDLRAGNDAAREVIAGRRETGCRRTIRCPA